MDATTAKVTARKRNISQRRIAVLCYETHIFGAELNVPHGSYNDPTICNESNLTAISVKLQDDEIVCADSSESHRFIVGKTFAYFDPPYRSLTETASFTS